MPTTSSAASKLRPIDSNNEQEMLFNLQTAKITQLITEFKKISTKLASSAQITTTTTVEPEILVSSSSSITSSQTPSHLVTNEFKFNTTVLAGIISGIGLVIVVINLVVLFMCRRNLKNFLKSSSNSSSSSSTSSSSASSSSSLSTNKNLKLNRDDLIQEYFEAFSTLHNHNSGHKKNLKLIETGAAASTTPIALMNTIHRLQHASNSSSKSGDESLLQESAKLFYNPKFRAGLDQDLLLKRQLLQMHQEHQQTWVMLVQLD